MIEDKDVIKEFDHFCECLNLKHSALDGQAIRFMNEFNSYIVEKNKQLAFALKKLDITKEQLIEEIKLRDSI